MNFANRWLPPEYIEQQKREVQQLKEESEKLGIEILKKKGDPRIALDEEKMTRDELNQFSSLKTVMKENGVTMSDNSKFVGAVVGARNLDLMPRLLWRRF